MRLLKRDPLLGIFNGMLVDYPSPSNISYLWNFGSLAGFALVIQLLTGIFLAMHYTPHVDLAFLSVEHIMRDVNYGWFIRYTHANGASLMFIFLYLHIYRGIYYGSYTYPRQRAWIIGCVLFLLTMLTGFLGYVLPWGQMSFWGATVITNLASVIPVVGQDLVYWIWGGFSVDNATLNRFFSLHYLLPFIVAALSLMHLMALHDHKSNNPLGINSLVDMIPFHPYMSVKDLLGIVLTLMFLGTLVFFYPNALGESDNYIPANPVVTPAHIVPEWYFLPYYAILRSIPDKLLGVVFFAVSVLCYIFLPFLHTSDVRSSAFRPIYKKFYWLFVANTLVLGWLGAQHVEEPYYTLGQLCTVYYFLFIFVLVPGIGYFENYLMKLYQENHPSQK